MDRFYLHTFEILELVRSQQANIIKSSNATFNNTGQNETHTIHNETFINFELKWLLLQLFGRGHLNIQFRDEINKDIKTYLADA